MSALENNRSEDNPFAAPLSDEGLIAGSAGIATADLIAEMQPDEIRAVIGRRADYYLKQWSSHGIRRGPATDVNWPAFFLRGWWLAYRKMYKQALIYYASTSILFVATMLSVYLFELYGQVLQTLPLILGLAVAVVCGKRGNAWYRSHVARIIGNVDAEEPDAEARPLALRRRGGTNMLMGLAFVPVSFFAWVASNLIGTGIIDIIRMVRAGS